MCTMESLNVEGSIEVSVKYRQRTAELELIFMSGEGPVLHRRDWLLTFRLDLERLSIIRRMETLNQVLDRHPNVFKDELG